VRLTLRDRAAARERAVAAQIHVLAAELAAHVRAGRTLAQAIGDICDELPEPAAGAARRVAAAVALGVPAGDAMARLGGGSDGAVLAAAVQVQLRLGGDLAALLDGLAAALLDHADARRAAEVATAQARATARTVAALPAGGGALLALVDRPALVALIGSPLGLASLACSALLCAGGLALIRRLAAVES
jgi:tight adherence protein B